MDVAKIPIGRKPPDDVNVIVDPPRGLVIYGCPLHCKRF